MYAIIETGSKQYKVKVGTVINVELLNTDEKNVNFDKVLFFSDDTGAKVGKPYIEKSAVQGELIDSVKGPKVITYKYSKRKNFRRKVGHRQKYSKVKITAINVA
ncbi:MAG: 50S ribosomal protein L21 [Chlamydiae bacterium]|nr:50S ribosomal protein L21 [Chlamydiota bacterium]